VSLPEGYESSKKFYPVLFLLDANPRISTFGPSFYTVAEDLNVLGDPIPEMIILGVKNTNRNRDMLPVKDDDFPGSGKAADFLLFITNELIPEARARYRISDFRILYGRSDSALFALYALINSPDAFDAVIAASPTLGHCPSLMMESVKRLFLSRPNLARRLSIIYGGDEGDIVVDYVPRFAETIEKTASENFVLNVRPVPGGGHIPESSLEKGLRFIFSVDRK
jgi:predicted alpha/beta superfamily hydrolase